MTEQSKQIAIGSYVVVTTEHRGVFGGVLESRDGNEVVLTEVRVCVRWGQTTRGFVGLAVTGPLDDSRVSPAAERMVIPKVTSIIQCSEEARAQWETGPWN